MIRRVSRLTVTRIFQGRTINIRPRGPLPSLDPVHVHLFVVPATAAAMATLSSDGLQALLGGVGVESPIPSFPLADIQNSPMGTYISYLAEILVQLTECVLQVACDSPNDLGDLVVVLAPT